MPPSTSSSTVRRRPVVEFVALAFGLSWTAALALHLLDIDLGTPVGTVLVVVLYMWAPAIAAIVLARRHGASLRERYGLRRGRLRWVALAWLVPVGLLGLTLVVGLALPEVRFRTDHAAFLRGLGLPEEQVAASVEALRSFPGPPWVLLLGQGLLAGLTINAAAALGEELGWRGFLLTELSPLGFWRLSGVTGVVWGLWHAPLVLQGHNFPDAPVAGVFVMTGFTLVASPVFTYLTARAESVLAPTLLHGSFNAVGSLSLVYLTGAGNLLLAPVGVAGIGGGLLATAACVLHDRLVAAESITAGGPLSPWG